MEIGFSKIYRPDFTLCLSSIPQERDLCHCMVTTAQKPPILMLSGSELEDFLKLLTTPALSLQPEAEYGSF